VQNNLDDKTFNVKYDKDLKQLYSKIMAISGYIIAMRSDYKKKLKRLRRL
jgi:hypothetical protein